ncbi:hypothetical protein EDD90_7413 [Streptomyces sp. Ag109_O5-1]|uniref:hypothetical protein n=1 Tax=Streptomyces sp. Ag109_O5-1 TaxID=1938851 RepID=UPI000FBF13D9|nr:hypothetical protein [Streptomyces sp. Ag109_O5-1]RPE44183.1 hypothetical protein EDD90_7413 [Streptomyces sp. Ag109_O5-1]
MKPYDLPDATWLTRAQHSGWACVFCRAPLSKGAVKAGRAEGMIGAHDMSIDVYACPSCALQLGLIERLPEGAPR